MSYFFFSSRRRHPRGVLLTGVQTCALPIFRRTAAPHRDDVLSEIAAEYRTFKRIGPLFLQTLDFHGRAGTAALRNAMTVLSDLDGDWRKPLPADVPLGHVERRWHR